MKFYKEALFLQKQNVSKIKDPFSESDSEEENVVTTGGDQLLIKETWMRKIKVSQQLMENLKRFKDMRKTRT